MAKAKPILRTEEEILEDLKKYVESKKRNRPSALAPIKRDARTKRICDYIFSHPHTFKLDNEIKQVPMDVLTEEMLIKLVLANTEHINLIPEDLITIPVMVAYEFSKRRSEHLSAMEWRQYAVKFEYPEKIHEVRDSIEALCDELPVKYNDEDTMRDYELYVNKVSQVIGDFFKNREVVELEKTGKVHIKYSNVHINTEKKVLVLISGEPDAGKTTFGRMLSYRIHNSVAFDSDQLHEQGRVLASFESLVKPSTHVIIFSDPHAHLWFSELDRNKYDIINIVIIPSSVEKMYRNSKMKQHISYDDYIKREANNPFHEEIDRDITVTNNYDERLWESVDDCLEDMSILLDFDLPEVPNDEEKKLEKI